MFMKSIAAQRPFKLALIASIAAVAAAASAPGFAANSASASATANVMVPISISSSGTLSFGKFSSGSTGGSVVVNTAGTASKTGDVVMGGGTPGAATFTVTGEKGAAYTIDTSTTTATLSDGGTNTMALALISDFTGAGATSGTQSSGTLDGTTGQQVLHVGGTLTVGPSQAAGAYTGTVNVAVNYQ